jgi:hypothetical protein
LDLLAIADGPRGGDAGASPTRVSPASA